MFRGAARVDAEPAGRGPDFGRERGRSGASGGSSRLVGTGQVLVHQQRSQRPAANDGQRKSVGNVKCRPGVGNVERMTNVKCPMTNEDAPQIACLGWGWTIGHSSLGIGHWTLAVSSFIRHSWIRHSSFGLFPVPNALRRNREFTPMDANQRIQEHFHSHPFASIRGSFPPASIRGSSPPAFVRDGQRRNREFTPMDANQRFQEHFHWRPFAFIRGSFPPPRSFAVPPVLSVISVPSVVRFP